MSSAAALAGGCASRKNDPVAALLTQERPNLFSQSVANLEPRAEVRVRLRYVQRLEYEAGGYELVFPMVAGPRYVPPSKVKGDPAAAAAAPAPAPAPQAVLPPGLRSSHDISVEARIDAGVPVTGVSSPSHRLAVDGGRVTLAAGDTVPNKDFILRYRVAGARRTTSLALASGSPAIDDDVSTTNTISRGVMSAGAAVSGGCASRNSDPGAAPAARSVSTAKSGCAPATL